MFSIFREWYLIYRLRSSHLRERIKLDEVGILSKGDTCTHLDTFLNKVAKKRFFLFSRSKEAKSKRKASDIKIIEKSLDRSPPYLTKTNFLSVAKEGLSLRIVKNQLTPEQRKIIDDLDSISDIVWEKTKYDKDDVFIKITGDGDQFTFFVACSEFIRTHWLFFSAVSTVLLYLFAKAWRVLDKILN